MDYQKKYAITQQPGDFLLMQWERGYKKVELSYNDRLIHTFTGSAVKKGLRLNDEQLGRLDLKFSEKPMGIDVIVEGIHSPANRSHPRNELKKSATLFWIITVFAAIASAIEGVRFGIDNPVGIIVTGINLFLVSAYLIAAIFTGKSKPWAYYLGFSVFCLMFLLTLLTFVAGMNFTLLIAFGFRVVFLVMFILNLKHAIAVGKHARYGVSANEELLDS